MVVSDILGHTEVAQDGSSQLVSGIPMEAHQLVVEIELLSGFLGLASQPVDEGHVGEHAVLILGVADLSEHLLHIPLGISSPRLQSRLSSSASIMVPLEFLSYSFRSST